MLLPKIRKDWLNINNHGDICDPPSHWMGEVWSFHWLDFGFSFYIGKIISTKEYKEIVDKSGG